MFNFLKKGSDSMEETKEQQLSVAKDKRTGLTYECIIYPNGEVRVIDEKGNAEQMEKAAFEAKYDLVN